MAQKLAALELQLCRLVHPDWLPLVCPEDHDASFLTERSGSFSAALSRYLIDQHQLEPLAEGMFVPDWTYAVLGGHEALRGLANQLTTYLIATWVQGAINGVDVRALQKQLGHDVYVQALHHQQALRSWRAPGAVPENLVGDLTDRSHALLDVLWQRHAPALAPWAALMSAPRPHALRKSDGLSTSCAHGHDLPSQAVLEEINQRLQADFEIDATAVFQV